MTDVSEVYIFDDMHPEDNAMSQALYSRSPASIVDHRVKIDEVGSGKFMSVYYTGYGHASIGDCGSTTAFVEQVSMLVAKAIQDNPLYRGQEASTRYLDFSKQKIIDPYNHSMSTAIQQRWMDMYDRYMPLMVSGLSAMYPFMDGDTSTYPKWQKTIKARAFDIMRSLLPVGTTTLLSWHTDLRQLRDHIRHMSFHPVKEVRDIALSLYNKAIEKYPNSFSGDELNHLLNDYIKPVAERYLDRNDYDSENSERSHYLSPEDFLNDIHSASHEALFNNEVIINPIIETERLKYDPALMDRPEGSKLPRRLMKYGQLNMSFLLDFGSFRDVGRHRNGLCQVPLVSNEFGFFNGYEDEFQRILDTPHYIQLMSEIEEQLYAIENLNSDHGIETNPYDDQYLYPMGMACGCAVSYSLPQVVYVAERRSQKDVHFTLRPVAQKMGKEIAKLVPDLNLYVDNDPESFTLKRGDQDIVKREELAQ